LDKLILKQEQKTEYNIGEEVLYNNLTVLSKPFKETLTYKERVCPSGHHIKLIKVFAIDEEHCPECGLKFEKEDNPAQQLDVYFFTAKTPDDEKISIFSTNKVSLNIYDKINVLGNAVTIVSRTKGIYHSGVFVQSDKAVEKYAEETIVQKSFFTKKTAINEFMANRPIPNYPEDVLFAWKHALFLAMVKTDINILTMAEPSFGKTESALQVKEITNGTYVDTPNSSAIALIGTAVKDIAGGYHFEGGAIFQARNNVLIVDEVEKMKDYNYLRQINTLIANHSFTYRKANIFYEDNNFHISFLGYGNPNTKNMLFNGVPKYIIENTFYHNPEFLSRMHLIFAFKNKGIDTTNIRQINLEGIKTFIRFARSIKVKPISKETAGLISNLSAEFMSKNNDGRIFVKVKDLCEAEAKLNLSDTVTEKEVSEVRNLLNVSNRLLFER